MSYFYNNTDTANSATLTWHLIIWLKSIINDYVLRSFPSLTKLAISGHQNEQNISLQ